MVLTADLYFYIFIPVHFQMWYPHVCTCRSPFTPPSAVAVTLRKGQFGTFAVRTSGGKNTSTGTI